MSDNYGENNAFNLNHEMELLQQRPPLKPQVPDYANNRIINQNQQKHQQVPTPEPRRRSAAAVVTTTTTNTKLIKHEPDRLGDEVATDDEQQVARLVQIKHYQVDSHELLRVKPYGTNDRKMSERDPITVSRAMQATGYDSPGDRQEMAESNRQLVTSSSANEDVCFDDDDEVVTGTYDNELADEYYDDDEITDATHLNHSTALRHTGTNVDQLTNLSRQSMVPIHELIAYYQYIQHGDEMQSLQPQSLDMDISTTSSAATSRQSSSASQQTTKSRHSNDRLDSVDETPQSGTTKAQTEVLVRSKRYRAIDEADCATDKSSPKGQQDCDGLQVERCYAPKIFVENVEIDTSEQHEQVDAKPKSQDRSRLRANVVLELINSERDFVQHLKDVVEGYLNRARKHPEIFTAQRINTIFANIEQLYEFQREFLEDLERCIDWSDLSQSQVGQCFLRYEKGFSVYHYYCNNHPNATSELQDLFSKPIFRAFFEECRLKQNMIDISLDGFLLTPIQKICKYPLQLNELLKNTSESHPDYQDVSNALESMRNCANLANERKRRIEALADIMSFQEKVDNWFGPKLSDTSSMLIHSGEVSKMTSHTWSQGVQLYLFDHLLLYSKRDILKRNNLILKGRICMDTVTEISDADEYKSRKSFKLYCSEQKKWFVFTTKSEKEKDEWIRAFERERNLVEADENEGFHITDRELGIARRTLQHRKRSRSARYRHHASKRPDTAIVDQLELDDPNMMINRTLSLPSCIHPSHVMNFVEDSRVVSSSQRNQKNPSPGSNSRQSPMASSQHLANNSNDPPGEPHQSGPTNWLRKMGSKKLTKSQVYQINGQTGHHQQSSLQHQVQSPTSTGGMVSTIKTANQIDQANTSPTASAAVVDVDKAAIKYDELEKRHRDHMVSEQQARLYRLNNDLPPPPTLYSSSITPIPFSGANLASLSGQNNGGQNNYNGNNRPKSSPSHQYLNHGHQNHQQTSFSPLPPHASRVHSSRFNAGAQHNRRSSHGPLHESTARRPSERDYSLDVHLQKSLQLQDAASSENQERQRHGADHAPSSFEAELVLSSGRVVRVREDAV